jgi:hypothetical protein
VQRCRGVGKFGQVAAVDGPRADGADPVLIDAQVPAVGAKAGVDRAHAAGSTDRGAGRSYVVEAR